MQGLNSTEKCTRSLIPKRFKRTYKRIDRINERKFRDLCTVNCSKNENQKILL